MTDTPSVKPTPLERALDAMYESLSGPEARIAVRRVLAAALSDEDEMVRVIRAALDVTVDCERSRQSVKVATALRSYFLGGES